MAKRHLIDWDKWDEKEGIKAWKKMSNAVDPVELIYAFYGGLRSQEIELKGYISNNRGHHGNFHIIDFDFAKRGEAEESMIEYNFSVPIEALRGIVQEHDSLTSEPELYSSIYSDEELCNAPTRFVLTVKE